MDCGEILFSGHAVRRMFERALGRDVIVAVVHNGEVIADYPDDQPHPSCLLLGFAADGPLHVVAAREAASGRCIVVTAYVPDPAVWSADFRTRRT